MWPTVPPPPGTPIGYSPASFGGAAPFALRRRVTLSNADLLTGFTVPRQALPAPAAGRCNVLVGLLFRSHQIAGYSADEFLELYYPTAPTFVYSSSGALVNIAPAYVDTYESASVQFGGDLATLLAAPLMIRTTADVLGGDIANFLQVDIDYQVRAL